jgi:GntR family transcriptional regulator
VHYVTQEAIVKIDPGSHIPIYLQIAAAIRAAVAAGLYRPGEALPSLRALAIAIQVNPNTVQRAYDELAREGLIYSQRGKGLFVAERGMPSAQERAKDGARRAFEEGIRAGQAAGMSVEEVREVFEAAMDQMAKVRSQQP